MDELQFMHGQDAMFLRSRSGNSRQKRYCSELRPQTVTNFMHGIFGLLNLGAGGGLLYCGMNALVQGKSSISLAIASLTPPAAIVMGVALLAIGFCLLGLLVRDKGYSYQLHRLVRPR